MKFINYLNEEYYKRFKNTEIYVNPSRKELLSAFGKGAALRWMSNWKKKLIYVWNADYIHLEVADVYKELLVNCLVRGEATLNNNGTLFVEHPVGDITTKPGIKKPIYKNKLDYLQPYFDKDVVKDIYDSYDSDVSNYGENWLRQWWE